ncbi:MAG: type IV toxin-antitoxin system AbiEi family antitoxin domain-containing protein [Fibrobacteraceae bacterium]|nr:type IV toxin-antitoxin system AbiEi family antitoxin domain-containing protein [Fibrobacteraceae bacterium]
MILNERVKERLELQNGILSAADVVSMGFSRNLLSVYVREGLLVRVKQGLYSLPDWMEDDMFTLARGYPRMVFSHESALFLNGLSDRTPFIHAVSIPKNTSLSAAQREKCICHYVKPEFYDMGIITCKTVFGNEVRCYNAERTICDLVRAKNKTDIETLTAALKNYAASKDKNVALLGSYASSLKVIKEIQMYMGVLL